MAFLSRDSHVRVPKSRQRGLPGLWSPITLRADLRSKCGLNKSCNSCRELSNGMWHIVCNQVNRVDSRLLVVGSQTANLTPDLSFAHNLRLRCPNEQYEPILDIYTSIAFQWYKGLLKARSFDPCNCTLKIRKSFWDSNSQHGSSLGSVRAHSLTLFTLPWACGVLSGLPLGPQPCLGREPKARVATFKAILARGLTSEYIKNCMIALIPKSEDHSKLGNWHPITLLGSIYKILAKL
jgi:hypothetical protein